MRSGGRSSGPTAEIQLLIETLIYLIIILIVAGLLFWALQTALAAFPIPQPVRALIQVAFVLVIVLVVLGVLFGGIEVGGPILRR